MTPKISMEMTSYPAAGFDPNAWVEEEAVRLSKLHGEDPTDEEAKLKWRAHVLRVIAKSEAWNPFVQLEREGVEEVFVLEATSGTMITSEQMAEIAKKADAANQIVSLETVREHGGFKVGEMAIVRVGKGVGTSKVLMQQVCQAAKWLWPEADFYEVLSDRVDVKFVDREKEVVSNVICWKPHKDLNDLALAWPLLEEAGLWARFHGGLESRMMDKRGACDHIWRDWRTHIAPAGTQFAVLYGVLEARALCEEQCHERDIDNPMPEG